MPAMRPRRLLRSPIRSPAYSTGAWISTFMMGSSSAGLASCLAVFHRFTRRQLEGQLRRIHIMVRAVVQYHAEIHHRESGQESALGRLDDALFPRRDVVLGDRATEDLFDEFKLGAARQRLHFDPAIAELAVAAGLFLVAALDVGVAPYGFAIRNLRRS